MCSKKKTSVILSNIVLVFWQNIVLVSKKKDTVFLNSQENETVAYNELTWSLCNKKTNKCNTPDSLDNETAA